MNTGGKFIRRGALYILLVALWLFNSASMSVSDAQTKPDQPKDVATIQKTPRPKTVVRGRVIYEDNRRPVRRVQVAIYDPANRSRGNVMGWTNGRGEFQFKDIPPGKYFVVVTAPGIIRSGPFTPEEGDRDLTSITVDNNSQSDVVVRVKRGGAVSGKVTYADGDPAINASIKVFRKKDNKWTTVYLGGPSTDRVLTDERGVYRVSGLSPGEYLIGAAEEKWGYELTARDEPGAGRLVNRAQLQATYYNGATTLSGATPLRVDSGDEQTGINITLAERTAHNISGVVRFKEGNLPVARARISLERKDDELPPSSDLEDPVANTDEEGRFVFDEVYEGIYTITVSPPQPYSGYGDESSAPASNIDPTKKFVVKRLELNLAGADISNLMIDVSSGRRVSGVVTVDGGKSLPRNVSVHLEATDGDRRDVPYGQTQPDGSFSLDGVPPGRYFVRTSIRPNNEYYTKSVLYGRSDIVLEPLTVTDTEDISNLKVVISSDIGRLSGRLVASDGKSPERGVGIVFVSAESVAQRSIVRQMYGFTNADGGFSVTGAPGEYLVIVMRSGEGYYGMRGDELISRAAKAQRVTLQPGENNKIELIVPSDK